MMTTGSASLRIGVGIDTARYGHQVSFLNEDRQAAAPPLFVPEDGAGYDQLRERLMKLLKKHPAAHFHIHLDAAGQYAVNLEHFLRQLDVPKTISVGEPKRNKDYHQVISPKRKSDQTESQAMARFAVVEQPLETKGTPAELVVLREIASRLEAQVKTTTQAINRLHNLMARVFPELATIAIHFGAGWVLQLLDKYPTPDRIARALVSSLAKIPYVTADKAARIQAAAKSTVGTLRGEATEAMVRQAALCVRRSQADEKQLEDLLEQAFHALPAAGHLQLTTIPGIGVITAAILVAKIVSIDRFPTPENLVGYFGIFPEERSSGTHPERQTPPPRGHMSRKGNDLVRRYLFCAARSAITYNPAVKSLYARLRARGTRGDVALGHCMRKMLHLVFAVWSKDQPFHKEYYPWSGGVQQANDTGASSVPSTENTPQESADEKVAVGHKPDMVAAEKVVTTADLTLEESAAEVKAVEPSDIKPAELNQRPAVASSTQRPPIDYAWLRSQISIEQVLRELGCLATLKGQQQLRGPCPFHAADKPENRSFSVHLTKNVFRCLNPNCKVQGNALDLWAAYHQLPLYEAASQLAQLLQLTLQPDQRRGNP